MYCSFQENQSGSNRDPVGIPSLGTNCALFGACWEAAKPFKKTTTFLQGFGTYELPPSRQRMNAGEQYATPAAGKPQPKRELRKPQQPQNQKARKTPNQPPPRASHPKHWRNPPGSRATKGTNERTHHSSLGQMKTDGCRMQNNKPNDKPNNKPSHHLEGWASSHNKRCRLHINKPILNSTDVRSLVCDDPTIPRREALVRFRRNAQIRRPRRTTPANVLKRAKLTATIPDAGSRQLTGPSATTGSRAEKHANTNRTSFRAPKHGSQPNRFSWSNRHGSNPTQKHDEKKTYDGASAKHPKRHEPCAANNHPHHDNHHHSSSTCDQYQHEPISTQHQKTNHWACKIGARLDPDWIHGSARTHSRTMPKPTFAVLCPYSCLAVHQYPPPSCTKTAKVVWSQTGVPQIRIKLEPQV